MVGEVCYEAGVDYERVERLAALLKAESAESYQPLNFYSYGDYVADDMYPPLDHPEAINFFFFVILQNHGFWYGNAHGYDRPLVGRLDSKEYKGSDLLWRMCHRAQRRERLVFRKKRLAEMTVDKLFREIFVDDDGPVLFPDLENRLLLTQHFGRFWQRVKWTPAKFVAHANDQPKPLKYFHNYLRSVIGFGDLFSKKTMLLAMALANRPEGFLRVTDPESWQPVVDYHLMRVALRLGLVRVTRWPRTKEHRAISQFDHLAARRWSGVELEHLVRLHTEEAVKHLVRESRKSMAYVDYRLWQARRYCPEMTAPKCGECPLAAVCAKHTELFQPVYRTHDY
jgi:hypothetical protein